MRIIFEKDILNKALITLSKTAQNKVSNNLPGAIYLSSKNDHVELQANSFDMGMIVNIPATIEEEGKILVDAKYFQDIVRNMPEQEIILDMPSTSRTLTIRSGKTEYQLLNMQEDQFRIVERFAAANNNIQLDTLDFKNLIELTLYAVADDDNRPIFTGALMEIKDREIRMVGTDTHRLALKIIELPEHTPLKLSAVIPKKTLSEILRLIPVDNPNVINITWMSGKIAFEFDNTYLVSQLVDGVFPDYERIIPNQFVTSAKVQRKELTSAINRVSLFSKDASYNAIQFHWDVLQVNLSSQNIDVGMAKEEVFCELSGNALDISFNGKYITDVLKHGIEELGHFYFSDRGPVVIRLDGVPNYTYVVTPIRSMP